MPEEIKAILIEYNAGLIDIDSAVEVLQMKMVDAQKAILITLNERLAGGGEYEAEHDKLMGELNG